MKSRFTIDIAAGTMSRSYEGRALSAPLVGLFTARDTLECEVVLMAGATDVTTQILTAGMVLRMGLRAVTSEGAILAQSTPQTMVDGVANCVLDLNTTEMAALEMVTPAAARRTDVYFEVEVRREDGSYCQTFLQQTVKLQWEVNMETDEPPAAAAASQQLASESATRAAASADAAAADADATAADRQTVATDKATVQSLKTAADADAQATAADRQAVATDKATVQALKTAADADAQATAADRQTVATDKATVQSLKTAADADAQATAADRIVVASDKAEVQVLAAYAALSALNTLSGYLARETTPELSDALRTGRLYI